jgi:DNA-binding response OmpR family regulator
VDQSADVLAYLRELLRNAGYNVLTNSSLHDSLILMKATRPNLTVLGPNLTASPGTQQAFRTACATVPVVELGNEFSTLDAGQAASELLERIRTRLHS